MKWSDVTVAQLPEIDKLLKFKTDDLVEMFDRDVRLISIFTGLTEDAINGMTPAKFGEMRKELYAVVSTQPTTGYYPILHIGGRTFSFVVSVNEVTTRELADLHLLQINGNNYYQNIPYILALFAKERKGINFLRKPLTFTQKVELFKGLPADRGNSISLFFCQVSPLLESRIKDYLDKQMKEAVNTLKAELLKQRGTGGDGMPLSMN